MVPTRRLSRDEKGQTKQVRKPAPTRSKSAPRTRPNSNPKSNSKAKNDDASDSGSSDDDVFEHLTPKELKELERILRSKEEALVHMQHQLRQRETQVFVLEEQTIELLENEDKRLKDKESELRHWEKVLKKEVKKRHSLDGNLPAELRDIDTDSTFTDTTADTTDNTNTELEMSTSHDKDGGSPGKKDRKRRSGTKEHCIVS